MRHLTRKRLSQERERDLEEEEEGGGNGKEETQPPVERTKRDSVTRSERVGTRGRRRHVVRVNHVNAGKGNLASVFMVGRKTDCYSRNCQ